MGKIIRFKDIDIYRKLKAIGRRQQKKKIKLGDRPERLMAHDIIISKHLSNKV